MPSYPKPVEKMRTCVQKSSLCWNTTIPPVGFCKVHLLDRIPGRTLRVFRDSPTEMFERPQGDDEDSQTVVRSNLSPSSVSHSGLSIGTVAGKGVVSERLPFWKQVICLVLAKHLPRRLDSAHDGKTTSRSCWQTFPRNQRSDRDGSKTRFRGGGNGRRGRSCRIPLGVARERLVVHPRTHGRLAQYCSRFAKDNATHQNL